MNIAMHLVPAISRMTSEGKVKAVQASQKLRIDGLKRRIAKAEKTFKPVAASIARTFPVDNQIKSRHIANAVLAQAGSPKTC